MKKLYFIAVILLTKISVCTAQFEQNHLKLSSNNPVEISEKNHVILSSFNFSDYREYNKRKRVQIKRGPEIELFSIQEMQQLGVEFDQEFLTKNIAKSTLNTTRHTLIPLIEIGWNYEKTYYVPESEKVVHQNGNNQPKKTSK